MRDYNTHTRILLRRRSARQEPVRPRPRPHGHAPASSRTCPPRPTAFLDAVEPYRDGLVVGVRVHVRLVLAGRPVRARDASPSSSATPWP